LFLLIVSLAGGEVVRRILDEAYWYLTVWEHGWILLGILRGIGIALLIIGIVQAVGS
jgi:hypothetical protein